MCIGELFPNVDQIIIEKILNGNNIELPDSFDFSDVNIIIGPNGAGKTRLLNILLRRSRQSGVARATIPD